MILLFWRQWTLEYLVSGPARVLQLNDCEMTLWSDFFRVLDENHFSKLFLVYFFIVLPSDFVPDRNNFFVLPAWPQMAGED